MKEKLTPKDIEKIQAEIDHRKLVLAVRIPKHWHPEKQMPDAPILRARHSTELLFLRFRNY